MSDKEWIKEAAESIALAALRYRTFQMPTRIAEIITAHCPQLTGEDLAPTIWKADEEWDRLQEHDQIDAMADWGEWIGSFVLTFLANRAAATPQVTPALGDLLEKVVRLTDGVTHKEQINSPLWLLGCEIYDDLCDQYGSEALRREVTSEQASPELARAINEVYAYRPEREFPSTTATPQVTPTTKEFLDKVWQAEGTSKQASPTPERCPQCGVDKNWSFCLGEKCIVHPHPWHAGTQKGTKLNG